MNSYETVLGIDIGGTGTSFGLVNRDGELLVSGVLPTNAQDPAEALVTRIHETVGAMLATIPDTPKITGIGIGAPNANYRRGTVENPPNLNWGESVNLVALFQQYYPVPVVITNDANAAALGEMYYGGARGMKDFMVITLGTGLGSGIVANGELVYGASGFAGELGHTVVEPDGRVCACGKRGCLETYVSATGLCRTVSVLLGEMLCATPLRDMPPRQITAKKIYAAACDGDVIALTAYDRTARILGMKLADAVAHTSPEAIFLAGGLADSGDILIKPARHYLEEFLFPAYRGKVRLQLSGMQEGDSAILGAAALVRHTMMPEQFYPEKQSSGHGDHEPLE